MNRNVLLLVSATLAFILSAVSAQSGDEILVNALCWAAIGGALFTASHLPS